MFHQTHSPAVFLHIPKTGGTTVHDLLCACFPDDRICSGSRDVSNNRLDRLEPEKLQGIDFFSGHFNRLGVERVGPGARVFTVLREPKSRILSLYYFWKSHRPSYVRRKQLPLPQLADRYGLLEFLRCPTPVIAANIKDVYVRTLLQPGSLNPKSRHALSEDVAVQRAKQYLDSLFDVGVTEQLDSFVPQLFRRLGLPVPPKVPRSNSHERFRRRRSMRVVEREELTDEIQSELERLTVLDQLVYQHARQLSTERADRRSA